MIQLGQADVVVAGGMESMSQAPHLLVGSREGVKYGNWTLTDSMQFDGLFCAIDQKHLHLCLSYSPTFLNFQL